MSNFLMKIVYILFLLPLLEVYTQRSSLQLDLRKKSKDNFSINSDKKANEPISKEAFDPPVKISLISDRDVQHDQLTFVERKGLHEEEAFQDKEVSDEKHESCKVTFNVPLSQRCLIGNLLEGQISTMQQILYSVRYQMKIRQKQMDSNQMFMRNIRFATEDDHSTSEEPHLDEANPIPRNTLENSPVSSSDTPATSEAAATLRSLSEEFQIMMTNLELQIDEADERRRKLENSNFNLSRLVEQKQNEIDNHTQKIDMLINENIRLRTVLNAREKENHVLNINNQLLLDQHSNLETAKQKLEEKCSIKLVENEKLNLELSVIRNRVKSLRHEQLFSEERILNATERISEMKFALEQLQKANNSKIACADNNRIVSIDSREEMISNHTHCGVLINVSEPYTIRQSRKPILHRVGVWMRDSAAPKQSTKIWSINQSGVRVRKLYQYANLSAFQNYRPEMVYTLPVPIESNGAVIYNGSLYFQRRNSRRIVRFKLAQRNHVTDRSIRHAGFHGMFAYQWGGFTDIDFAVDETGLWVLYSTPKARGNIIVSKIDPLTLQVVKTIKTPIPKRKVSNSFIICQVLYTVSGFRTARSSINYSFDLNSKEWKKLNIPFQNNYQFNTMVDYNPADRYIYAWDNGRQVRYKATVDDSLGEIYLFKIKS